MASNDMDTKIKVKRQNTSLCIFCHNKLDGDNAGISVLNPTDSGLQTIFEVARERQDHVFHLLQSILGDRDLNGRVSFHMKCRSRYTGGSSTTKRKGSSDNQESDKGECASSKRRLSRTGSEGFQIKLHCFICGKASISSKAHRHEKLTAICTGTGSTTREKVLDAANDRGDEIVRLRMIGHPDLFASEAKYHRTCYSKYITAKSLSAAKKHQTKDQTITAYDNCFSILCEEIKKNIIVDEEVTTLQAANARFQQIFAENSLEVGETKSWKLKDKLLNSFEEKLSFISRKGLSDVICSSNITVGKALLRAPPLLNNQTEEENMEIDDSVTSANDDTATLHRAAAILRRSMESVETKTKFYPTPHDLELSKCFEFIPKCLYNFLLWLQDEEAFDNATAIESGLSKDLDIKVLTKCHEIIAAAKSMQTPMTLSLALKIHHDTGSRTLVDILHKLGHCVSYDEVRRFLSSAAVHEMKKNPPIPYGVSKVVNAQNQIDAAIDNFDRNEQTIDGKSTTHAMAMVIYQRSTSPPEPPSIERLAQRSVTEDEVMQYEENLKIYPKPKTRPEPPEINDKEVFVMSKDNQKAVLLDLLWVVIRRLSKSGDQPPDWSKFNSLLSTVHPSPAVISYLPFIHASPTAPSTVYTALLTLVKIATHIGQDHILVTADLAIYKVAQEIIWSKPPLLYGKITMRLGVMHLMMAFIASIGTLYSDGGLMALLVDSGVYAPATAHQMLQGKQLARAIRGLRLAFEAMLDLQLKALFSWIEDKGESLPPNMDKLIEEFQKALESKDKNKILRSAEPLKAKINQIESKLAEFSKAGRSVSSTFAYWANFIDAVGVLLRLLRADRDADFDLHLNTVLESIPWMNAGGRNNYAKYTPIYVAEMRNLEKDKPLSYQHMKDGGFVVRRSNEHQFNAVATDQALEQTINNECKSQGGVIGFTLKKGALTRWLLTRHISSQYATAFSDLSNACRINSDGLGKTQLEREQEDVVKMIQLVENQWQNPFLLETTPSQLINISSGRVAPEEIEKSLVHAFNNGTQSMNLFCQERLLSSSKTKSFWQPVKSTKIPTFAETNKPVKGDTRIIIESEVMFRRLLAVAQHRDVNLENVLKFELSALPPCLFKPDGTIRSTEKAELTKKLETVSSAVNEPPDADEQTAYLLDGMSMLHALPDRAFKTFNDLGELVLKNIDKLFGGTFCVEAVVVLFDRYDNPASVKSQLRSNRYGSSSTEASHVISGVRNVPPYQRFLLSLGNRESLALFVCEYIRSNHIKIQHDKEVILAGGFKEGTTVVRVTSNSVEEVPALFSSQEEADTRIILHTIHQALTKDRIIIRCDDTDVLILLVYYKSIGAIDAHLYMHVGHSGPNTNNIRFIFVDALVEALGEVPSGCLPAVHSLTGCDSTNSMFRIGKRKAFTTLLKHLPVVQKLQEFGNSGNFEEIFPVVRKYVLFLYGNQKKPNGDTCRNLDELRYVLATKTDKAASQLPPTEDAFRQHSLRCFYQTRVWKSSHIAKPELPSPIHYGWQLQNGQMEPVPCKNEPAPIEVRDYTHLFCNDKTCTVPGKCPCKAAGMACIPICKCNDDCENHRKGAQPEEDEDDVRELEARD